ncbi:hypothetical protein LCGC14_1973820, partial [marine sediment metagenome]
PSAQNARTHTESQIAQIGASITEWGWTIPVLVDEVDTILAGHGRVLAAQLLGLDNIPVMVAKGWSEEQKRAYVIADNKLAENAGWDMEALGVELTDLSGIGFDLGLIGFSQGELNALVAPAGGHTGEDDAPDAQDVAITCLGDVWRCGGHRVLCGDATDKGDVERALDGAVPHLMVTDPPYGVEYDAGWRNRVGVLGQAARAEGTVTNDDNADWRDAWVLFPGDVVYVWHAGNRAHIVAESLINSGFEIRHQVIWAKNNIVIGRGHYHPKHEPCWYAVRINGTGNWQGDRKQTTVWNIDKSMKSETGLSAQKPVECMRRPIVNNSKRGDHVYDPFLGSGTTMIAAESVGRVCYGLEIEPTYVDVTVRRWQEFTGEDATLDGDGRTFTEIAKERDGAPRPKAEADTSKARDRQSGKAKHQARRRAAKSRAADAAAASQ